MHRLMCLNDFVTSVDKVMYITRNAYILQLIIRHEITIIIPEYYDIIRFF